MSAKKINPLLIVSIFVSINLLSFLFLIYPKLTSILDISEGIISHVSSTLEFSLLTGFGIILISAPFVLRKIDQSLINTAYVASITACLVAIFGGFYTDIYFLLKIAEHNNQDSFFMTNLSLYFEQNMNYYLCLMLLLATQVSIYHLFFKVDFNKTKDKAIQGFFVVIAFILPLILIFPLPLMNIKLIQYFHNGNIVKIGIYLNAIHVVLNAQFFY